MFNQPKIWPEYEKEIKTRKKEYKTKMNKSSRNDRIMTINESDWLTDCVCCTILEPIPIPVNGTKNVINQYHSWFYYKPPP